MGEESMTLDAAMELMGELRDMDQLEQQVQQVMRSGNIEDLDLDNVEEIMGEDARRQLEQLQKLTPAAWKRRAISSGRATGWN